MSLELFVPGRVCLFGEHTDWSGSFRRFNSKLKPGRNIVVGTNAGVFAKVSPHPDSLVLYSTDNDDVRQGPFTIREYNRMSRLAFAAIAACVAAALCLLL